jgi:class 3 adenylate cyclase
VAYQVVGDQGPPVVYLHSWFSNLDAEWDDPAQARWLRRFGASCRLILIDKSGSGLSDRVVPPPDAAFDVWSDEVIAVLDDLNVDRAALLASSWSGPLALHLAARHAGRIERFVLWGTFACLVGDGDANPGMPSGELVDSTRDGLVEGWGSGALADVIGADPGEHGRERLVRYERAAVSRDAVGDLADRLVDADSRALLPQITVETLVVHVENPIFEQTQAEYLHEQLPNSTLVMQEPVWQWREAEGDLSAGATLVLEYLTGTSHEPEVASALMVIMFLDIVGSTTIVARLGDREWADTLKAFNSEVGRRISYYRGRTVSDTGDGFLAVFPTVRAAFELATDASMIGERLGTPVRIGIHVGDCHMERDQLRGLAVHAAARLLNFASDHDIVVTEPVVALAPTDLQFESLGKKELRGVPGQFSLHRLLR